VASKSLVEWPKMLWENWTASERSQVLLCLVLCPSLSYLSHAAGEFVSLL
jgi:hypothetical protein